MVYTWRFWPLLILVTSQFELDWEQGSEGLGWGERAESWELQTRRQKAEPRKFGRPMQNTVKSLYLLPRSCHHQSFL